MNVQQIYTLVNNVTSEILGNTEVVAEDLSNVVDVGTELFNASSVDNYVKSLVNHIGKVIFVDRPYAGSAPSVLMDGWEYGSVLQKISSQMPVATENASWELTDGTSYDPNVFTKPTVSSKFFNSRTTFEIPLSVTDRQVKESFSNAGQLNAFISMLYNEVAKSMTVKTDALVMRTINNFTAQSLYNLSTEGAYTTGNTRCINLYELYKAENPSTTLTAVTCVKDPSFLRFAAYQMSVWLDRMKSMSTLFNIGGMQRFTSTDRMHFVALSDFYRGAEVYLQSDTWHNEYTKFPTAELVPYWQGTGTGYDFNSVSTIHCNILDGSDTVEVTTSGILAVAFDRDALGVCNQDNRVTTNYNPKAEFTNMWYKRDSMYFNDLNENFVVFYVA